MKSTVKQSPNSSMRILISGFEPFGKEPMNPTQKLVEPFVGKDNERLSSSGVQQKIRALLLPVTFESAFKVLSDEIDLFQPDFVLSFGLASGRSHIEIERVAINCLDAEIPDNAGFQPVDLPIEKVGESAYFSTLPIRDLIYALNKAGVPARISNSAGTYVCNFLFYRLQELTRLTKCRSGFIHVPLLPEQVVGKLGVASLEFEILEKGLETILNALKPLP